MSDTGMHPTKAKLMTAVYATAAVLFLLWLASPETTSGFMLDNGSRIIAGTGTAIGDRINDQVAPSANSTPSPEGGALVPPGELGHRPANPPTNTFHSDGTQTIAPQTVIQQLNNTPPTTEQRRPCAHALDVDCDR